MTPQEPDKRKWDPEDIIMLVMVVSVPALLVIVFILMFATWIIERFY